MKSIGIDFGSQKTTIVSDDGSLVLTDTGSISRPTLVSFYDKTRLVGEEAQPHAMSENTLPYLNAMIGKNIQEIRDMSFYSYSKLNLTENDQGIICTDFDYCGNKETFPLQAVLAIFLAKQIERIQNVYPNETFRLTFALSHRSYPRIERALLDACSIAGFDTSLVACKDVADCLATTYSKKLSGLKIPEKSFLSVSYCDGNIYFNAFV